MDSFIPEALQICTTDGFNLRIHCVIFSYVVDLTETENVMAVLSGNRSKRNCHICLVKTGRVSITINKVPETSLEMSLQLKEIQQIRDPS